jgi:hypothetical protein
MGLEQLNRSIDFVSDTTPSAANDGELFLDTSLSPPEVKVFDASVGAFVRPQTAQNLDQKVSAAGATQNDISSGVDASTTGQTVATNLDAQVSSAQGVDWSSKTPQIDRVATSNSPFSVSGSGYLIGISSRAGNNAVQFDLVIDGTTLSGNVSIIIQAGGRNVSNSLALFHRFESSFNISNVTDEIHVSYVLD